MPIIRSTNSGFTRVPNAALLDPSLSLEAKGLLALLLLGEPTFNPSFGWLREKSSNGDYAHRSALGELERAGYVVRGRSRGGYGSIGEMLWVVSDEPLDPGQVLARYGLSPVRGISSRGFSSSKKPRHKKKRGQDERNPENTSRGFLHDENTSRGFSSSKKPQDEKYAVQDETMPPQDPPSPENTSRGFSHDENCDDENAPKTGVENPVQDEVLSSGFSGVPNILLETKTNTTKTTTSSPPPKGREEKFIYGQWYSREYLDFYNGLPLGVQQGLAALRNKVDRNLGLEARKPGDQMARQVLEALMQLAAAHPAERLHAALAAALSVANDAGTLLPIDKREKPYRYFMGILRSKLDEAAQPAAPAPGPGQPPKLFVPPGAYQEGGQWYIRLSRELWKAAVVDGRLVPREFVRELTK